MKTWTQLDSMASRRDLVIYRQGGAIVLHRELGNRATLLSITTSRAMSEHRLDELARIAMEAVLLAVPV